MGIRRYVRGQVLPGITGASVGISQPAVLGVSTGAGLCLAARHQAGAGDGPVRIALGA